jgi:hypothetical protein
MHGAALAILPVTGSPASSAADPAILDDSTFGAGGSLAPASAADRLAVILRTSLDQITVSLARAAVEFTGREDWAKFGYARLEDHARERFKRSGRWVRDLAALGRGFDSLPGLEAAMSGSDGGPPVGQVATLLIARTASPDSVGVWLRLARTVTVRELKEEIRAARATGSVWPRNEDDHQGSYHGADRGEEISCPEEQGSHPDDEDVCERLRVRMTAPRTMLAAFKEGLELYRAVEGHQVGVTSFVDALVAEACAGAHPPDTSCSPGSTVSRAAAEERFLAQVTRNWRALTLSGRDDAWPDLFQAAPAGSEQEQNADPDTRIRQLLALQDRLERQLGRVLAEMGDLGAWKHLRFTGLGHYAEQRLGMARTTARDRAGLARKLRRLPVVKKAYADGLIGFTAGLRLVRILGEGAAGESLQKEWVERAAEVTVKRLRDEAIALGRWQVDGCFPAGREIVATEIDDESPGRGNGCFPGHHGMPPAEIGTGHHPLENSHSGPEQNGHSSKSMTARTGEVDGCFPARGALLGSRRAVSSRGLMAVNGNPTGTSKRLRPLSDAEWHGALKREPGMARERVWRLGWQAARETGRRAMCAARQFAETQAGRLESLERGTLRSRQQGFQAEALLSLALPEELAGAFLSAVEAARRGLVEQVSGESRHGAARNEKEAGAERTVPAREIDDRPSLVAARLFSMRGLSVPAWVGLLALIEEFVDTWDVVQNRRRPSEDAVHIRDGFRCMAPGCTSRRNLQEHHVIYRSQGGTDDMENRLCLCAFHHQRGEHGDMASCRGEAPLGIRWSLGRGGRGGNFLNEIRVNR